MSNSMKSEVRSRVKRVARLMAQYIAETGAPDDEETETVVADFVADLRHYCDAMKIDFHGACERSYGHYVEECVLAKKKRGKSDG